VYAGEDPNRGNRDAIADWSWSYWQELHSYSLGGAYINMMMEESEDRIRATYRDNYGRRAEIKAKYDPEDIFNVNQNIKPARATRPV
jgi:hypothetical protein